jgi:hypothetical protein
MHAVTAHLFENFIATDAQGRRVTDLTAADIQITDHGKVAPILAFRNDALGAPPAAPAPRECAKPMSLHI